MIQTCYPNHPEFIKLIAKLDAYLAVTDGDEHSFYNQFNSPNTLDLATMMMLDEKGIACGGYRIKANDTAEVKRMFVEETYRGTGAAAELLTFLEETAKRNGVKRLVLETGTRQKAAVKFYVRSGYSRTPNYPPYEEMENSVCFEKWL